MLLVSCQQAVSSRRTCMTSSPNFDTHMVACTPDYVFMRTEVEPYTPSAVQGTYA